MDYWLLKIWQCIGHKEVQPNKNYGSDYEVWTRQLAKEKRHDLAYMIDILAFNIQISLNTSGVAKKLLQWNKTH